MRGEPGVLADTHQPAWLARLEVPLLATAPCARASACPALAPWALDSGGFTELSLHGRWQTTPAEYAEAVARYAAEVGQLAWAAPQDWMCEPAMVMRTGLDVDGYQARTVDNYCQLHQLAPPTVHPRPTRLDAG